MTQANVLAQLGSPGISTGFKNRIINGAMVIDQRNAGAAVTASGSSTYAVDRFQATKDTSGATVTTQQSTTVPAGFTNSYVWTTSTGASPGASDDNFVRHNVEGYNVADFGLGTADAKAFTLSFWVRSSLTGTFGGVFANSASNRAYYFSYAISSANTWEKKTVTVAGDTSGTWVTNNGVGLRVLFDLGAGSSRSASVTGAWTTYSGPGLTGGTKVVGTTGATWYITGVQLEVGTSATDFEYRPYGTELALCQRYYQILYSTTDSLMLAARGDGGSGTGCLFSVALTNSLRASPTVTTGTLSFFDTDSNSTSTSATTVSMWDARNSMISLYNNGFTGTTNNRVAVVTPTSSTGIQLNAEL